MADQPIPFGRLNPDLRPRRSTALVASVSTDGTTLPEAAPDPIQVEALAFRLLGEAAERADDPVAAIAHYDRALELWAQVGCRRRRDTLLRKHQ